MVSMNVTTPGHPIQVNHKFKTLDKLFKRLNSALKEHGPRRSTWLFFRYFLRKTVRIDWRDTILFERSLADPVQQVIPKIKVNIRLATFNDLDKLKKLVDQDKYVRFQERLKHGNVCFIVLVEDIIVAFSWISFHNEYLSENQIEVQLKDKEAYFFDTFVDPAYRNKGLQAAMIPPRIDFLRNQGYEKIIGLVDDYNTYSLRALISAGYKPKKISRLIKIFGLKFHNWQEYTGKSSWK
jgi:RimJ/RimL family protein N-acetyltransferase